MNFSHTDCHRHTLRRITGFNNIDLICQDKIKELLNVLALYHNICMDMKDSRVTGGDSETSVEYEFITSLSDEKALVEACRRYVLKQSYSFTRVMKA